MEFQVCPRCGTPRQSMEMKQCANCGFTFFEFNEYHETTYRTDIFIWVLMFVLFVIFMIIFSAVLDFWMFFSVLLSIGLSFVISMCIFEAYKVNIENFLNPNYNKYREIELNRRKKIKETNRKKAKEEAAKQTEALRQKYEKNIIRLENLYGKCDKIIPLKTTSNKRREIRLYINSKYVVLENKEIAFKDIISYSVSDKSYTVKESEIERGTSFAVSKTDNGNMLTRAAVGGLLLGGTGAVIGGATAKKNTTIYNSNDVIRENSHTSHDYTINVNINDMVSPIIQIWVGKDEKTVNEIVGLLNVIINNNSKL